MLKRWVVEGFLTGHIHIPGPDGNLPITQGKVKLTPYAIIEQDLYQREPMDMKIYLGLEIPKEKDHVCIAWQEMELFVRALGIEKNVPITVYIVKMTDKPEEWPDEINFLKARDYPICNSDWQPAKHHENIKNRVRFKGLMRTSRKVGNLKSRFEELNNPILVNDEYVSSLIKDYMMGLEDENRHPSLAMLYYFKVLERVGNIEYNNPGSETMKKKTLTKLIQNMGDKFTNEERQKATSIIRWRNTKSEAHFLVEGKPGKDELNICKKMAYFYLLRATNPST